MVTTLYHGSHKNKKALKVHAGLCLTDRAEVAEQYAGRKGTTYWVDVELAGLVVMSAGGYDRDRNEAPGDTDESIQEWLTKGADVVRYEDEDEQGRRHDCWRLLSAKSLAAVTESGKYE